MPGRKPPNPLEPLFAPRKPPKKQASPLSARIPPQMLEELNEVAKAEKKPRNAVLVAFIRFGLDAYYRSRGSSKRKRD
jgi:hypothetical protein